ncbi:tryptophan synthase alpha chain [Archangium sp. Cb G35]|uniref:tryptophan synthase alpha chain n=1 Tax=Archangium sp. Cb G35 TaxID=1920190 RepID=UPI0009361124|nr:tryptophan synthase alpha chain [Archangium sp. Cb G35]OJT25705.1 tryptophan synthase alpha chain [Archangium sp. Cb G35]
MGGRGSGPGWVTLALAGLACGWLACGGTETDSFPGTLARNGCQARTCEELGLECGTAIDGCGGVLRCGTCPEGEVCGGGGVPNVCGPAPCTPATCASARKNCGLMPDGCGGMLACGTCAGGETCGGGGVPNVCGQATCVPATCASLGKNCGGVQDGCGGTLDCGTCPQGETCGGGGAPNQCGRATCRPFTCAELGKNCGTLSDGCGGVLECGTCPDGTACGGDGVPNVCGVPACTPLSCSGLGKNCGFIPDGCGGVLECGTCPQDETCGGGGGPNVCGPASCIPTTCAAQGKNCGTISNGCGGLLDCGECFSGQTCGGGGVANVCGSARCVPATCAELGKGCGGVPDGCGGMLDCGTCTAGKVCGGGGVPNVCAEPGCWPFTCAFLGKDCGTVPDGCGGMLDCGTCAAGEMCGVGGVSNVCYRPPPVCMDRDLGNALPVRLKGSTQWATADHQGSCGGGGTPDRSLMWTAPRSGTFTFDTARSAMDTLLCLKREDCWGEELACATEGISYGGGARVSAALEAGQRVLVVVDGATAGSFGKGDFELHIHELAATEAGNCFDGADNDGDRWVDCADTDCQGEPFCDGRGCADTDLGSALPVTYSGDTAQAGDGFQGTCGALLQHDRAHLWTAPKAGTFVFDTVGGGYGNALYVLTGCRGLELGCSASRTAGKTGAPVVKLMLEKGQRVLVVVDGMNSTETASPIRYTLHINEYVPRETGRCANGADDDADGRADDSDSDCR